MTMPLSGPLLLCASSEGLEQEVHPLICRNHSTGQSVLIQELSLAANLSLRIEVSRHGQKYQLANLTGLE